MSEPAALPTSARPAVEPPWAEVEPLAPPTAMLDEDALIAKIDGWITTDARPRPRSEAVPIRPARPAASSRPRPRTIAVVVPVWVAVTANASVTFQWLE